MLDYEKGLWGRNLDFVAGIDEVGRGCLFGDVVAAAVILPKNYTIDGINDSKKLTAKKREQLFDEIMTSAIAVGIGRVDCNAIDQMNIKQAARLAMKKAMQQLTPTPQYLLIDAEKIDSNIPQLSIIKGDERSQSIAAASIIAKVTRDRLCLEWDAQYPEYGIAIHKGYATKKHREMIQTFGPSPMHRKSFLSKIIHVQEELF